MVVAQAKTRPYSDTFSAHSNIAEMGASLRAFEKLLNAHAYRLVGCHSGGYNAFFLRRGIGELELPEYPIEGCFEHHRQEEWAVEIRQRRHAASLVPWDDV